VATHRLQRAHTTSGGKQVELHHSNCCWHYSLCLDDAMAFEKDLYIMVTCYLTPTELNSFGLLSAEYYQDTLCSATLHCHTNPHVAAP
jgi:hypothetical protein